MAHAAVLRLARRHDRVAGEGEIGEAGDARRAVEAVAEGRGEHIDDAGIAAVAVDHGDAAEAVMDDARDDVADHGHHRLGGERDRAGEMHVMGREPVPGRRQDHDRRPDQRRRGIADGGREIGVGAGRHVVAVLLHRADREHEDRPLAVERPDLRPCHVLPMHANPPSQDVSPISRPVRSPSATASSTPRRARSRW